MSESPGHSDSQSHSDSSGYADLRYAERDGVATITIDRPAKHNAFREQTMHELIAAFDRAESAAEVGVVVLTGAGDAAFSTGGDVAMEDAFDRAEGRRTARLLLRLAEAVRGTGKPVVAKIRGWCVGGGNELNLLCDLAFAAESARFRYTDARIGNAPVWFGTQLLPQLVGARRAREIIMLGRAYSATEAAAMGWINAAVPDAELDATVADCTARLLAGAPQALRLSKISLNYDADRTLASVRQGLETLTYLYETAEFHEGHRPSSPGANRSSVGTGEPSRSSESARCPPLPPKDQLRDARFPCDGTAESNPECRPGAEAR